MDALRLTLRGFSLAEKLDLERILGSENVSALRHTSAGGRHGNLGLYDVIVSLGPSVFALLGVWLSQNRRRVRHDEESSLLLPDGTTQTHRIVYRGREETSDADVVEQVAAIARDARAPSSKRKGAKVASQRSSKAAKKTAAANPEARKRARVVRTRK